MIAITNTTVGWKAWEGHIVPKSYRPEYVVLSFLISYLGSVTTLELIYWRTAGMGVYNLVLLALASISMGGIALWSMHFIANRALILGHGEPEIQIVYNQGYTALSFFVPISVLFLGFGAIGSNEHFSKVRIALGGTLTGLGVCGVYYLGQAGILNYDCIYTVGSVIGAALVAIVVCVGSLGVFFFFRSAWDSTWWKRAICALVLAAAVTGMNWLACLGTLYCLKSSFPSSALSMPTSLPVVIVVVFSVAGCLGLILIALLAHRQIRNSAKKAQQIVLATVVFDYEGKLLVTHEGSLPNRKITNAWIESSPDDIFSVAHPAFLWMFRASRNWKGLAYLFPEMKRHLYNAGLRRRIRSSKADANLFDDQGTVIENYPLVFRELFCVAAADLARDLNQPIDRIGVLYDDIVNTGQDPELPKTVGKGKKRAVSTADDDLEQGNSMGKGQLLFLVSSVSRREAQHLQHSGHRFAQTSVVLPILSKRLQVKSKILEHRLEIMRDYVSDPHILEPGVHMACFSIRAALQVGRQGFDILARKDAKNQLPTMQVPIEGLEEWQLEWLKKMDSLNVAACLKFLVKNTKPKNATPDEQKYAKLLLRTLESLKEEIDDPFFNDASLIAKPIEVPCRGENDDSTPGTALLLAFRLVAPIHSRAPGKKLEYVSLNFFKTQQHVYHNSPSHGNFARKCYREFTTLLGLDPSFREGGSFTIPKQTSSLLGGQSSPAKKAKVSETEEPTDMFGNPIPTRAQPHSVLSAPRIRFWDKSSRNERMKSDHSSEKGLVDHSSQEGQDPIPDHGPKKDGGSPAGLLSPRAPNSVAGKSAQESIEMKKVSPPAGQKGGAAAGPPPRGQEDDDATFVDELFRLTIQKRGF